MLIRKHWQKFLATSLVAGSLFWLPTVDAEVKMYTATAEDYPSPVESPDISKQRALDKAIKKATKEAGIYLKRDSRSVAGELTEDEITAITSNSWQLVSEPKYTREIINHSGDTQIIVWKVTVEVNVDDAELQNWIKRDAKDKSTIINQTREAQKASEENDRKVENLREQYNRATSQAEKDKIRKQMNDADRDFLANQKLEEALKLYYAKDYHGAIKLNTEAIELKPDWSWPYNNRGTDYDDLGKYERAIADYNKAIQLDPTNKEAYYNRGNTYNHLNQYERAIQDYSKAIELNPNLAQAYTNRGIAYLHLKQSELAIQDLDKAIELNPNLAQAYNNRGLAYALLGNFKQAIADATKAIQLNPNYVTAYQLRGLLYEKLGDNAKAQADFTKAKQLGWKG